MYSGSCAPAFLHVWSIHSQTQPVKTPKAVNDLQDHLSVRTERTCACANERGDRLSAAERHCGWGICCCSSDSQLIIWKTDISVQMSLEEQFIVQWLLIHCWRDLMVFSYVFYLNLKSSHLYFYRTFYSTDSKVWKQLHRDQWENCIISNDNCAII